MVMIYVVLATAFLASCGADDRVYAGPPPTANYTPYLRYFDIVDSYGVDTAKSSDPLAINPYKDNGLFDVFWEVDSLEDYRVNVRINDVPFVTSSYIFYTTVCGAGLSCDQGGNAICQYTSQFTLGCNYSAHPVDASILFKRVPQSLYMIVEVCDLNSPYCEYRYHSVQME